MIKDSQIGIWHPHSETLAELAKHNIPDVFSLAQVDAFIADQSAITRPVQPSCAWEAKFFNHVLHRWRQCQSVQFDGTAQTSQSAHKLMSKEWQPSDDVYDALRLANIDFEFAAQLIPEFVIYWRDSNQAHRSWNSRFLHYVKHRWGQRANRTVLTRGATQARSASTRSMSLETLVNDRSWAD
jgi:hypothetical protein